MRLFSRNFSLALFSLFLSLVWLASAHLAARPASADDRDLLREAVGDPYVFILFDTSGSMNKAPRCTLENFNRPVGDPLKCNLLCPTGDCYAPLKADDPNSKFYQAKAAMYEVLRTIDDVHFGFATYNQDGLFVRDKHWLYTVASTQPNGVFTLLDGRPYPVVDTQHVLGRTWNCRADSDVGCRWCSRQQGNGGCNEYTVVPARTTMPWEIERVGRLPKLNRNGGSDTEFYIQDTLSNVYRVTFHRLADSATSGQSLGMTTLDVRVAIDRCNNVECTSANSISGSPHDVRFTLVDEFLSWEEGAKTTEPGLGYFSQSAGADSPADNTCTGWDANNDRNSSGNLTDPYTDPSANTYNLRFPTQDDTVRGDFFDTGDVLPLDWMTTHRDEILHRFAPNTRSGAAVTPDFGLASYFENTRATGEQFLRLRSESLRPLIPFGETPLGNSIKSFRGWYAGCDHGSCPGVVGWSDYSAAHDPDWGCRRRYLLVVTDGDETCTGPDACSGTAALFAQEGVKTFVVAFGVENTSGNRLNCMAASGGTGDPIYPQNKQELIDALTDIFGQIREETRTFASAAVPSVQAEVSDKIYLSNFTPLNGESFWDGHLDAYLKPLPLTEDNRPDESRACGGSIASSCHLWDAGEQMVLQAPTAAEADLGTLKLGLDVGSRRVFYSQQRLDDRVPSTLRVFQPATDVGDQLDLWLGLNVAPVNPLDPTQALAANQRTAAVIQRVLSIKDADIEQADGTITTIHYVLGDIFHSDPVLISNPSSFRLFAENLHTTRNLDGSLVACDDSVRINPGYRCYAERQRYRRKMLVVGANDGQLHFVDSGYFEPGSPNPATGRFNNGTGREIFSYMPRLAMPVLTRQVEGSRQIYSLDSTLRIDDVFLDPIHDGNPTSNEREWRTVLIGGMREGGSVHGGNRLDESDGFVSGYYALDITQPDQLTHDTTGGVSTYLPSEQVVPSCIAADFAATGQHQTVTGCTTLTGAARPFPAELWTFVDDWKIGSATYYFDEENTDADSALEGNGERDLGDTWSIPVVTQVLVCTDDCDIASINNDVERRYVAIFGGGLDPDNKATPRRGTWIYMVDVETGQVLYKRQVIGAVPAPPAVVDDNLDGIADQLYVVTTSGWVYKIDLRTPGEISTRTYAKELFVPTPLLDQSVTRVFDADWEPFPIYSTGGRSIYYAPTAFFVAELGTYGLAFGTGDRENLWSMDSQEGRFVFLIDEHFTAADVASAVLPLFESDLVTISASSSPVSGSSNFVTNPPPGKHAGWVLTLEPDERILAQAFGLTGVLIFSTYQPQTIVIDDGGSGGGGNGGGNGGGSTNADTFCARTGDSRIFLVLLTNGNPLLGNTFEDRFRVVPEFVTNPYVEQGQTQNAPSGDVRNSENLSPEQLAILEKLKQFFPKNTRFTNAWISISASRSDTGYERYATIPIGIVQGRWKEE